MAEMPLYYILAHNYNNNMERRKLTPREIAIIKRRRFMMLADNGGESEPSWNMRVVAHPKDGYEMPQTTGNFSLVKQDGDTYFYQHDGSSSTGDNVFYKTGVLISPWGVTDVTFKDCEHITIIGGCFLSGCDKLTTLDLTPLSNITSVRYSFLEDCGLTSLDLTPLSNITSVGNNFLSGCKLTSLDLTPLSNITSVGNNFLQACKLTSIDLSPLSNVTNIGNGFLRSSTKLTSLDLTPLSNVTNIGNGFLDWCQILNSLKLPWTTIPTTQADRFMSGVKATCEIIVPCESVETYKTTSPWSSRADYINGGEGCEEPEPQWNMKVVAHPDEGYSMPTTTGNFTLMKQDGDTYYYQHNGSSSTGENVLYKYNTSSHWKVSDAKFNGCEHITTIGTNFLYQCSGLTSLDLSPLQNVTSIGNYFLYGCAGLTSLDLSPLQNVTSIGNYFLRNCSSLTSLDLSPLNNVTNTGTYFLAQCSKLTSLDLSPLQNVTYIGNYFLQNCRALISLKLPWTTIPTTSTTSFMSSVPTSCSIEVPCESVDIYKTTTPWSSRADYINGGEGCE
ncbi:MAG: leucine-rich repeat domain-containing protein [Oscillospiraceae bacterium]|nr:leucine-rich repeat domain-containing protein [Candidatus Ruminococcus equi]